MRRYKVAMNSKTLSRTDFLFATPSFSSGLARTLDLYGTFDEYNTSDSEAEADERAIASDWFVVGSDLRRSLNEAKMK